MLPSWNERPSRDHLLVLDGPGPLVEEASLQVQATMSWFPLWLVRERPGWIAASARRAAEEEERPSRLLESPRIALAVRSAILPFVLSECRGLRVYNGPNLESAGHTPSQLSHDDLRALALAGDDALEKAVAEEARGRRRRQPCRGLLARRLREHRPPLALARSKLVAQVAAALRAPYRAVAEAAQAYRSFRRGAEPLLADPAFRKRLLA